MKIDDTIGLTDFFVLVYNFIKHHLKTILVFTTLGALIGGGYSYQKENYYYSELSGYSLVVPKANILEVFSPLTVFTDEKNYEELSKALNLSIEEATNLRVLEFAPSKHIKTSNNPKVTDDILGEIIIVKVETYDKKMLPKLESGLLYFLSTNTYLNQNLKAKKEANSRVVTHFYTELDQSDSLRYKNHGNNSGISIMNTPDPKHFVEALEYIESIKMDNNTLASFTVVSSFYNLKKPANKTLLITIAATLFFFILGLFFALTNELAKIASSKQELS